MTTSTTQISVLIVEDEGIIAENLRELLVSLGYNVLAIAATSEQAMSRVAEKCPDVILMDIRIKGKLDGIATTALLNERFDVPIIYLTAHADGATIERAKMTEPFGYLMKPVKPPEVRSAIEIAHHKHSIERRLRGRERWLSTTLRSIADAVIMVDLAGRVTFMNPVAESLLGVKLSDALGQFARDVLRLTGAEWYRETPLDRALAASQPIHVAEAVLESSDGSRRVIADSAAPVMDDAEVLGAVMVFRDVTEQKHLQAQLEIADRLASLGTMAAGVAHEINNPLAVVVGNAEFVLEHLTQGPSALDPNARATKEALDAQRDILSAASRIARIVADLRAFSRPEPGASGSLDVRDAIEWAVRSTAHEFRHRARLITKLEKVPRVDGEETRLGQVLVNLLINAAHAIAPGNTEANAVTVATRADAGGGVVIEVTDTGSGIVPEILSRIFLPFFTTKAVGVGTGLGLAICHGIVASMGGELGVESVVGKGTTFRITLPPSSSAKSSPSSEQPPVASELRGRLMVIDDEDMVLKALSRILSEHEVVCTANARHALVRLEADDRFDVILCDLMMPSMTGMDFYEALLQRSPELARRVVFLTGGALTAKVASFLDTVPNLHIQKPFGAENLRAMVQQLLCQSRGA